VAVSHADCRGGYTRHDRVKVTAPFRGKLRSCWHAPPIHHAAPKTAALMVIDQTRGLEPSVHYHWSDERESSNFQPGGQGIACAGACGNSHTVADQRHGANCGPGEVRKILTAIEHPQVGTSIPDYRLDLHSGANDPGIFDKSGHIVSAEGCHDGGIEPPESDTECVSLLQNRFPRESRLEAVKHQLLPKDARVALGPSPLLVMVLAQEWVRLRPAAPMRIDADGPVKCGISQGSST
jgi:hypothetical protein